ncbi:MAG: glycoside hydrolase family 97 catalytic domain-containing protein [Polyangiaceae bacterium]|nr:glycoside hydrolase family 97 catalytic domain-containing protein [Polyangiaceae bacterium]
MDPHYAGNFRRAFGLAAALAAACGGTETSDKEPGSGGSTVGSGGMSASTGGSSAAGGSTAATGGQPPSGGRSSSGAAASGGPATGGSSSGGQATGGTSNAGTSSGGQPAGGASTGGGRSTSGGRSPAGGSPASGGTSDVTGGADGVGGTSTGGTSSGGTGGVVEDGPYAVSSPDGRIQAELSTTDSVLRYRITVDGEEVLAPSEIGIRTSGVEIGRDATLGTLERSSVDESYDFFGAHTPAVNQANEGSVPATSGSESYTVDLHVANDGVGIRLRLAAKAGRKIEAERSTWRFDGNPTVWATPLEAAYEQHYRTTTLNSLGTSSYGMPLTAKVDDLYVSITEAALKDYGDMGVKRGTSGALEGTLYADTAGWTTDAAVVQPWRVTIIANDLTALVNSTLVQNLNPPRDASLSGADWIKPGRSTWQWMAVGAPQYADQQQWVDWTQELGFEYYLVDDGWKAWSDAWNSLKSVCTYAAGKGVKVWLWVNSNEVKDASARRSYFKQAADIGIAGVKIDFPPACDRWWSTWYWDVAKDAAQYKLLVDVHGANKPTGIERTWPNMLTREAIRGHEYQMTRYSRVLEPAHDTILPFTRLVAGAADYTPTVFAPQELQGNTWAHELAQGVVFTSPFLCFSGHPKDYVANTAVDVLEAIPAVWDETRVLPGSEPGKVAALARKSGGNWFVGILNGADATTLDVPLGFLGSGTWNAIRLGDVSGRGDAWDRQEGTVSASDSIQVKLSSRGGFVAWFKQ